MSQSDERVARDQVQKLLGELGKLQADSLDHGMLHIDSPDEDALEALRNTYRAEPEFLEFVQSFGELHFCSDGGFTWYTPKPVSAILKDGGGTWYLNDDEDISEFPDYLLFFPEDGGDGCVYFLDSRSTPWKIINFGFEYFIGDPEYLVKQVIDKDELPVENGKTIPEILVYLAEHVREQILNS